MKIGPITTSDIAVSPLKQLQARAPGIKTKLLFDTTKPHAIASEAFAITTTAPVFAQDSGGTGSGSRARIQQLIELERNPLWQQCGVYCTFREDGIVDASDGFYTLESLDIQEISQVQGWAEAQFQIVQRKPRQSSIGIWWDSKLKPNAANLGGSTLVAFPAGVDTANCYPPPTWTLVGRDGNIVLAENPGVYMRVPFLTPTDTMTKSRCQVTDETSDGTTLVTEIFFKDHQNRNGYTRINNGLLRYTLHLGDTGPLLEVWSGGAWVTVGNFLLQSYNGSTYDAPALLQGFNLLDITPEEVSWEERRYNVAGSAFMVLRNRIRRGSRMIECQITGASGIGMTGARSVEIANAPLNAGAWTATTTLDGTGVAFTNPNQTFIPSFLYTDSNPNAPSVNSQELASGLSVPSGTVQNVTILVGLQDAIYTAMAIATPAAATIAHSVAGTTTWAYKIAAVNQYGVESAQSATVTDTTGATPLNGTNFETLTFPTKPAGWASWSIYRVTAGGTPNTTGLIGQGIVAASFNDTGLPIIADQAQPAPSQSVAYVNKWASYNRNRVKQQILVDY